MFETVLGRLQALAQAEGFDPQPGTVIDGELRAYAAGIALVYDQLTDARGGRLCRHCCRRKSLALADGSRFAAGGYPARDPPKAAGAAANALGRFFFSGFSTGTQRSVRRGRNLSLHGRRSGTGDPCRRRVHLGRLLRDWVPPFLYAHLSGSGRTWNALDADAVPYAVFDRAALPFDILDTED